MSPFLMRLDHEWKVASTPDERGEIEARRAGYLARTGDFEGAKSIIAKLRSNYADGHNGQVTVRIMIAEALIRHFECLDPLALDRISRAQLLSRMMSDRRLEAISSAWKAHIEFDSSKFDSMFDSLRVAIDRADASNDDAWARIANLVCKTAILCGFDEVGRKYFHIGRTHALKEGDQASIEALQHNKAAFRLARVRSSICFDQINSIEIEEIRTEISTARSLQNLTGISALSSYIDLCHARLLMVEGKFAEAVGALESLRGAGPFPVGSLSSQLVNLDIAYCLYKSGSMDVALEYVNTLNDLDMSRFDADEVLVARWIKLQLVQGDPKFGSMVVTNELFEQAAVEYKIQMNNLRVGLEALGLN